MMITKLLSGGSAIALAATICSGCGLASEDSGVGRRCTNDADCGGGVCAAWFADKDGDGHGDPTDRKSVV